MHMIEEFSRNTGIEINYKLPDTGLNPIGNHRPVQGYTGGHNKRSPSREGHKDRHRSRLER
jgi:hypothetical protein